MTAPEDPGQRLPWCNLPLCPESDNVFTHRITEGECIVIPHTTTPSHDPGLDHLLEEVAVEVLRQDAAGWGPFDFTPDSRETVIDEIVDRLRWLRAIDQAAGGEQ